MTAFRLYTTEFRSSFLEAQTAGDLFEQSLARAVKGFFGDAFFEQRFRDLQHDVSPQGMTVSCEDLVTGDAQHRHAKQSRPFPRALNNP
jgi:hypothetical protein